MPLNEYQQSVFVDVVDIYKGTLDTSAASDGFIKGKGIAVKIFTGIQCKIIQTSYATQTSAIGRRYGSQLITDDRAYFAADQALEDATFFQLRTPGHPEFGKWWAFQSDPETHKTGDEYDPNYSVVLIKATTDPTVQPANGTA